MTNICVISFAGTSVSLKLSGKWGKLLLHGWSSF